MKPRVVKLLTLVSLLVCLAAVGLWVRTADYWTDRLERYEERSGWAVYLARNRVSCRWYSRKGRSLMAPRALWHERRRVNYDFHSPLPNADVAMSLAGFHYGHATTDPGVDHWLVVVPLWAPAFIFAVPPAYAAATWWRKRRRRRRERTGHRPRCGYDLTGNVSGVCPECGARAVGATRSA
jgi:hypothetical protein